MALLIFLAFIVLGSAVPAIEADEAIVGKPPIKTQVRKPCPSQCKQTCTRPTPNNCAPNPLCSCPPGYVYPSPQNNTCIRIYECPPNKPCNGDKNAEIQYPVIACPSTCQNPDQSNCKKGQKPLGCVCKTGYILSKPGGKCIKINNCPFGTPCNGGNRTYDHMKLVCPWDNCPATDEDQFKPCNPDSLLPSGCVCKRGYRLNNGKCVTPLDCPPVECSRPNEIWDSCPPNCYSDYCFDVPKRSLPCDEPDPSLCEPTCRCKPNFARGPDRICIPVSQCPPVKCSRPNEEWDICPPSCYTDYCSDVPKRFLPCDESDPSLCQPRCRCMRRFARGPDRICIPIRQCPIQCTGANEVVNPCPLPCYTDSCSDVPYRDAPCNTLLPVKCVPRCECSGDYARADDGTCVLIDQCP